MQASALLLVATAAAAAGIDQLGWLAGHWQDAEGTEEVWLAPAAGSMAGVNRSVRAGRARVEFLRIETVGSDVHYVAAPEGQATTRFVAVRLEAREARFENPAHDFPTWIHYQLGKNDQLSACVGDAERQQCWQWRRRGAGGAR